MKKVLIMEDELNIRSFVVINLKRAGYDVIEAGDGQEALDAITANPDVGVTILDIMVPGDMDGFEVCRRIRATNKQMGIIMLTARTQEMDSRFLNSFSAGCPSFSYMAKKKKGIIRPIIRSTAAELPMAPRVRKYTGSPTSAARLKQISWRFVRPAATLVLTVVKSLGTGT